MHLQGAPLERQRGPAGAGRIEEDAVDPGQELDELPVVRRAENEHAAAFTWEATAYGTLAPLAEAAIRRRSTVGRS